MIRNLLFYSKKSPTFFNLYNPSFCGNLLRICLFEYEVKLNKKMPFSLTFLILPLLLHKELRDTINHYDILHTWTFENYPKLIDFNKKTKELIEITKASLMFLLQTKTIKIHSDATIEIEKSQFPKKFLTSDSELADYYKKARYLGRWFAFVDDIPTIFALLGVKP